MNPARVRKPSALYQMCLIIPMNLISFVVGVVVRLELPQGIQRYLNRAFAWLFKLDLTESKVGIEEFTSLEAVFIRSLQPGCRPIHGEFVSPADGTLTISAPLPGSDQIVQAKSITCSAAAMICGEQVVLGPSPNFNIAWNTTVYLAPHNYHRVHSPVAGELRWVNSIPGELWPVNQTFTKIVPRLWSRNERLVFGIAMAKGWAYVVMVGAFNVGRMASPFLPGFVANGKERILRLAQPFQHIPTTVARLECGDELGVFMLGSTVVILLDQEAVDALQPAPKNKVVTVKYGASLL